MFLCCSLLNAPLSQIETTADKGGISLAPDDPQATSMAESSAPTLPKSESDTFLTTPDEDDDKIINVDTGLEGDGLEHRRPKKDLLEIDRFTICGNRIDWVPYKTTSQGPGKAARFRDQTRVMEHAQNRHIFVHLTHGVFIYLLVTKPAKA